MAATTAKPQLAALKTPLSATYPSELRSPMVGTPTYIKKEEKESLKTPITPPAAYVDFLKALSPVLMSPMPTGTRHSFSEKQQPTAPSTASNPPNISTDSAPALPSRTSSSSSVATTATADSNSSSTSTSTPTTAAAAAAADRPTCSTNPSQPSTRSNSTTSTASTTSITSTRATDAHPPKRAMSITIPAPPPPSPFQRPLSARTTTTPRQRLHIPQSPYSPAGVRSPMSAHSVYSPYSSSAGVAVMSPAEWVEGVGEGGGKLGGTTRQVSVRQVVTRTVMYSARKPVVHVEPVPVGKKRKIEE